MLSDSMPKQHYDYIIIGAGLSGLSLAKSICRQNLLKNSRILIVERREKLRNDRTWAYWSNHESDYDALAQREWHKMLFSARGWTRTIDLGLYRYRVIRGADFYQSIFCELAAYPNIHIVYSAVTQISDGKNYALVHTEKTVYFGKWIFDSAGLAEKMTKRKKAALYMNFLGWKIKTEKPYFNPDEPVFLDFRTRQDERTRFFYVLPYSETEALVEYTAFIPPVSLGSDREEPIKTYIKDNLKITQYEICETEMGSLPLRLKTSSRKKGKRIIEIGIPAGMLKPTSGFAFTRIMQDNENIVKCLLKDKAPYKGRKTSFFYRMTDAIFMRVMLRYGEHIKGIFYHLFKKNPVDRVFRFLDEEANLFDCLKIMSSLPKAYFFDAILKIRKKPYIGKEASAELD